MIVLFHCLSKILYRLLGYKAVRRRIDDLFVYPVYLQRYERVVQTLVNEKWRKQIRRLVDFGCSHFGLHRYIYPLYMYEIAYVDIDEETLKRMELWENRNHFSNRRTETLTVNVLAGSVADPDYRLVPMDAVTAIELIEHLYPDTLDAFPYNVFGFINPKLVIVTTPNADFNVLFGNEGFRHDDHKFEWTREQFEDWATNITVRYPDYTVSFSGIGEAFVTGQNTDHLGQCTQMALFVRKDLIYQNHVLNMYTPSCLCDEDSPCKVPVLDSKLLCECVCPNCCPKASHGICTYQTRSKRIVLDECSQEGEIPHNNYYKKIKTRTYKPVQDGRTEDEILEDEIFLRLECTSVWGNEHFNREKLRCEISLYRLINPGIHDIPISKDELGKILVKKGISVQRLYGYIGWCRELTLCAITYPPPPNSPESSDNEENSDRYSEPESVEHLYGYHRLPIN